MYDLQHLTFLLLVLAMVWIVLSYAGCATGPCQRVPNSAGETRPEIREKKFTTPWRYPHMGHRHTKPVYPGQKSVVPGPDPEDK